MKAASQRESGRMTSAAGKAIAHDAIHAPGQIRNAVQFGPTAMAVEMAATIAVIRKVSNNGTTM